MLAWCSVENCVGDFSIQGTWSFVECGAVLVEVFPVVPCRCGHLVLGYPLVESLSGERGNQIRPCLVVGREQQPDCGDR